MPDDPRFAELKKSILEEHAEVVRTMDHSVWNFGPDIPHLDRYFDRDGDVISISEWSILLHEAEYKRVDQTIFEANDHHGQVNVSTVWLGMDHSYTPGVKQIFETMVFGLGDGSEPMHRYGTIDEAKVGHRVVATMIEDRLYSEANAAPVAPRSTIIEDVRAELPSKLRQFDILD